MPSLRVEPALRAVQLEGDEVMVQMRRSAPRVIEEEDGVITSAAPLDLTLRRPSRAPAPPARRMTATGEQPPGYIADASTSVAPKAAPAKPPLLPASAARAPAAAPPVAVPPAAALPAAAPEKAPVDEPARQSAAPPSAVTMPAFALNAPGTSAPPSRVAPMSMVRPSTGPNQRPSQRPSPLPEKSASLKAPSTTPPAAPLNPLSAPTLPAVPAAIPRPRAVTVRPPAAPTETSPPRAAATSAPAPPRSASTLVPAPVHVPQPPSRPATLRTPPKPIIPPRPPGGDGLARPRSSIPPAPSAAPPAAASSPKPEGKPEGKSEGAGLDRSALESVEAFADVPPETLARLSMLARVEVLGADDEVSGFGAALLVEGGAVVSATIVDEPVSRAEPGTLVPTRGTLAEAVALRVVAGPSGARVALWDQSVLDEALGSCPWVLEELAARADRLQALAGATMGPLGELDEAARNSVLERLTVHVTPPRDEVPTEGAAAALVCVGSVEIGATGQPVVVRPGEVLFPRSEAQGARAGAQGAILLVGDASVAAELAAGPPALAALFKA
jgi:hypothetical protein